MSTQERDVTKLPRWVQDRIESLERDVAHWKAKAYEVGSGETDTQVEIGMDFHPLPNESRVRFGAVHQTHANGFRSHNGGVDVRWDPKAQCVEIHGDRPFVIKPIASNHLTLEVVK